MLLPQPGPNASPPLTRSSAGTRDSGGGDTDDQDVRAQAGGDPPHRPLRVLLPVLRLTVDLGPGRRSGPRSVRVPRVPSAARSLGSAPFVEVSCPPSSR